MVPQSSAQLVEARQDEHTTDQFAERRDSSDGSEHRADETELNTVEQHHAALQFMTDPSRQYISEEHEREPRSHDDPEGDFG